MPPVQPASKPLSSTADADIMEGKGSKSDNKLPPIQSELPPITTETRSASRSRSVPPQNSIDLSLHEELPKSHSVTGGEVSRVSGYESTMGTKPDSVTRNVTYHKRPKSDRSVGANGNVELSKILFGIIFEIHM